MLAKTFVMVLLATFYSPILGDTRPLYHLFPVAHSNSNQAQGEGSAEPFNSLPSVAAPRFGYALWNPFDYLTLDALVQPAITCIGFIFGLFGFVQITDWLGALISNTKKKGENKKKPEETNEVDEARKKRTISVEESQKVLESIEKTEKKFGI